MSPFLTYISLREPPMEAVVPLLYQEYKYGLLTKPDIGAEISIFSLRKQTTSTNATSKNNTTR